METVGYAALQIIPTTKGLGPALSSQVATPLGKVGADAGTKAGVGFKSKFLASAKGFAAPLAALAGGAAVIGFLKDGITGASALAESGNKVSVVFGDAADSIFKFSAKASGSIGQTELEARNAAATFGVFGKSAGLTGNDLSGFSTKLVNLTSDLASFYDTSPADAITAVGAALRGESEPIRNYGVLLDDATLRQQALKDGLVSTTKEALTPQQRVMAAYKVILKQTADAQGDFNRTSGGLANQTRTLSAQFAELETSVGQLLLPALTTTVKFANEKFIPAIRTTGGFVGDAAKAFGALPGPVKSAATALGVLAIAGKLGAFSTITSVVGRASTAISTLRTRTVLATTAFQNARGVSVDFANGFTKINPGLSRTKSLMAGVSGATAGLGASLKRGLGGVVGALGGPWGIAIAGGITALTIFASKNAKAAQDVEALRATLNTQTGAITKNSIEWAASKLSDKGFIDDIQALGLNSRDVTQAMLHNTDAAAKLRAKLEPLVVTLGQSTSGNSDLTGAQIAASTSASQLLKLIADSNTEYDKAREKILFVASANKKNADETDNAKDSTGRYEASIKQLKDQLYGEQKAADASRAAHRKLAEALSNSIHGNIDYKRAIHDAFAEAKDGKKTLDINTEAGRKNTESLLNVADSWNQLSDKTKSSKGRYAEARQEFLKVADALGATDRKAKRLADRLLDLPKKTIEVPIKLTTVNSGRKLGVALPGFADGGKVGGNGFGDRQLLLADKREWIMSPQASAYYGDAFMDALNKMRVPRYGGGGSVGSGSTSYSSTAQHNYHVYGVQSMREIDREAQKRARQSSNGSPVFG